jgi:hypothetical protein
MSAGASVSGRITYSNGDPLPLARVEILKIGYTDDGRSNLTLIQNIFTDDLGVYRLFWLPRGSYYLRVSNAQNNVTGQFTLNPLGNGSQYWSGGNGGSDRPTAAISRSLGLEEGQSYGTLYYPGTPDLSRATPIELAAGDELRNINIAYVPLPPKSTASIRGVALDALGQQPIPGRFNGILRPIDPARDDQRSIVTLSNGQRGGGNALQFFPNNGAFEFKNVEAGSYELRLNADTLSGRIVTEVRGRDVDVRVPMYPSVNVSGKVTLDPSPAATNTGFADLRIRLGNTIPAGVLIRPDGEFTIPNLPAATYSVEVVMPASWPDAYVKAIRMHNVELAGSLFAIDGTPPDPLEIVIHRAGGSIEGRVLNARQEAIPNASVILVPDQSAAVRPDQFRSAFTDNFGRYQIHALPAGDYNLYAWEDIERNSWFAPGFLQTYESWRQSVRVADAQNIHVDVNSSPLK